MQLTQKISPSLINYIDQCPQRWKYDQLGHPQLPVYIKKAELGYEFHSIIKHYFTIISEKPSKKEIWQTAKKSFENLFTLTTMKKQGEKLLKNFCEFEVNRLKTWHTYKPELVEHRIEISLEDILKVFNLEVTQPFVTIIDFYGSKTLIDWKTGVVPYISKHLQFQYIFEKTMLELTNHEVEKTYFVVLSSDTCIEPPNTTKGWMINEIKRILNIIKTDRFIPKRTGLCRYCPYELRCNSEKQCLWMVT